MDRSHLVPTQITDKNGVSRRVWTGSSGTPVKPAGGKASRAAAKGETGLERERRSLPAPVLDKNHVTARDAAKQAFTLLTKGLMHGDAVSVIAGAIAFSAASVSGMRELRDMEWGGNADLSRSFVMRLMDMDVNKSIIEEFRKAKKPIDTYHGTMGMPELELLDKQIEHIEEDIRTAISERREVAADVYENEVIKNLVNLVLEDDPAGKAEELAKQAREYQFSDEGSWWLEVKPPYIVKYHEDSVEFRHAKAYAADSYAEAAQKLRAARSEN